MAARRCACCHDDKSLDSFNKNQAYCRDCQREKKRAWDNANREHVREYGRANAKVWYHANAERSKAATKQWVKNHPEARKAIVARSAAKCVDKKREYYLANAEHFRTAARENGREYRRMFPDKNREQKAIRRARERGARIESRISYKRIRERDGMICHLCGFIVDPMDLHFDHVIPLAHGGAHSEENIRVAHPLCNLSKGAKISVKGDD